MDYIGSVVFHSKLFFITRVALYSPDLDQLNRKFRMWQTYISWVRSGSHIQSQQDHCRIVSNDDMFVFLFAADLFVFCQREWSLPLPRSPASP